MGKVTDILETELREALPQIKSNELFYLFLLRLFRSIVENDQKTDHFYVLFQQLLPTLSDHNPNANFKLPEQLKTLYTTSTLFESELILALEFIFDIILSVTSESASELLKQIQSLNNADIPDITTGLSD